MLCLPCQCLRQLQPSLLQYQSRLRVLQQLPSQLHSSQLRRERRANLIRTVVNPRGSNQQINPSRIIQRKKIEKTASPVRPLLMPHPAQTLSRSMSTLRSSSPRRRSPLLSLKHPVLPVPQSQRRKAPSTLVATRTPTKPPSMLRKRERSSLSMRRKRRARRHTPSTSFSVSERRTGRDHPTWHS